jgi:hypothetical protein
MMFGSVSEHFANLRHVRRSKTCVSGQYALFRGTEVVKHPSTPLDPKLCLVVFGAFRKPSARKNLKNYYFRPECTI